MGMLADVPAGGIAAATPNTNGVMAVGASGGADALHPPTRAAIKGGRVAGKHEPAVVGIEQGSRKIRIAFECIICSYTQGKILQLSVTTLIG